VPPDQRNSPGESACVFESASVLIGIDSRRPIGKIRLKSVTFRSCFCHKSHLAGFLCYLRKVVVRDWLKPPRSLLMILWSGNSNRLPINRIALATTAYEARDNGTAKCPKPLTPFVLC